MLFDSSVCEWISDSQNITVDSNEKWYLNEPIWVTELYFNFKCNGIENIGIRGDHADGDFSFIKTNGYNFDVLTHENEWEDEIYRTIVLQEPASGELLTLLGSYATKL